MQIPTTIAIVALGLLFMAGAANAEYHNFTGGVTVPSAAERARARERGKWIDRERARQEIRSYNRQQERILYDAQSGSRFLDRLQNQGGLYERNDGLFDSPVQR